MYKDHKELCEQICTSGTKLAETETFLQIFYCCQPFRQRWTSGRRRLRPNGITDRWESGKKNVFNLNDMQVRNLYLICCESRLLLVNLARATPTSRFARPSWSCATCWARCCRLRPRRHRGDDRMQPEIKQRWNMLDVVTLGPGICNHINFKFCEWDHWKLKVIIKW